MSRLAYINRVCRDVPRWAGYLKGAKSPPHISSFIKGIKELVKYLDKKGPDGKTRTTGFGSLETNCVALACSILIERGIQEKDIKNLIDKYGLKEKAA